MSIQNLKIQTPDGEIIIDQDGNKYPSPLAKYKFLISCLERGIRSGNLKKITTVNQANDLLHRINIAASECHQPLLQPIYIASQLDKFERIEQNHILSKGPREHLFEKMQREAGLKKSEIPGMGVTRGTSRIKANRRIRATIEAMNDDQVKQALMGV